MADEEIPLRPEEEIVELRLRRRRNWLITLLVLAVLAIAGWMAWESRPTITAITIRAHAFQDEAQTVRTSDFDVVINGEVTPSDLGSDGARIIDTSYLKGTEIAISVRSSQNMALTTPPRYHTIDPRVLPKLQTGRFGIEESFVLGAGGEKREVRVRVVDERGAPLAGVPMHSDDLFVGVTKEDGTMAFRVDPTARVRVSPMSAGHSYHPAEAIASPDVPALLTFSREALAPAPESAPISVQALDELGRPLAGVSIVVDGFTRATTQSDGRAAFQVTAGSLVVVEARQGTATFSPSSQTAGAGTTMLIPFVRSASGAETAPLAGAPPSVPDASRFDDDDLSWARTDPPPSVTMGEAPGSSVPAASSATPQTPAPAPTEPLPPPISLSEDASGNLRPTEPPVTVAPPTVQMAPPPPERAPIEPPVSPPRDAASSPPKPSGAPGSFAFGTDYAAAEEYAKSNPADDWRIQFDAPPSAGEHEAYGRLLWIRAHGLERARRFEEAIGDYRRSYEYRPTATTAIDLMAAQYTFAPCGDRALLDEALRQATRQSVSAASREKLRAFTVFQTHCELENATDPDAKALAHDRLCEALTEYFDGVARSGATRFLTDVRTIQQRVECDR